MPPAHHCTKKIYPSVLEDLPTKREFYFFFQSNLTVYKIYDFILEIWATIKYYIGVISTAAKVLFKSILAIINIERPDSATCLAFHHNHLTVAYVFSLYFLQERPLWKRGHVKTSAQDSEVSSTQSQAHFSPTLLFICAITACRATFLSGSSGILG